MRSQIRHWFLQSRIHSGAALITKTQGHLVTPDLRSMKHTTPQDEWWSVIHHEAMTDVFILDCTEDWRQLQKQQTQRALKQPLSLNPIVHTRQRMWRNHFLERSKNVSVPSGLCAEENSKHMPDSSQQQQKVKPRADCRCWWVLTTVETDQTAEVWVGGFLLHSYRVCIAHWRQVVIHHLERTLRGIQPPAGPKARRWRGVTATATIIKYTSQNLRWNRL